MVITFKNRRGNKLSCVLEIPGGAKSAPAVLIVHGFKGFAAQRHIRAISDSLVKAGFVTLRPDLTKNPGKSYLNFPDMTYRQEFLDLEDVFEHLLRLPQIDKSRIGICGHSLSGMLVAQLASKRGEIKSLVTLSAVYDFRFLAKHLFNKPFSQVEKDFETQGWSTVWSRTENRELHIKKSFYRDVFVRTAGKFAHKIICPTLVIWGGADESVSQSHAQRYIRTIGSMLKKMEIIPGSDHNYSGEALDKVTHFICDWFSQTLAPI